MLLHNEQVSEEIKREIKEFLKQMTMKTWQLKTYGMQQNSSKREVYSKKKKKEEEKHQIDNLTSHLKQLGKEGHLKKSRRKEILQIRSEINEKEMQEQ